MPRERIFVANASPGQTMAGQPIGDMDAEYATTIADRAMRLMSQQSVPATPTNFAVWFEYSLGNSLALRKTIDILIGNKRKFDPATNRDLYRAYVTADRPRSVAQIDLGVSEQLSTLMVSAQQYLATAIDDNRTQVRALGEVSAEAQVEGANPRRLITKAWYASFPRPPTAQRRWRPISPKPPTSSTRSATRWSRRRNTRRPTCSPVLPTAARSMSSCGWRRSATMESGQRPQRLPHRHRSFQIVQRQLWTPGRRSGDQAGRRRVA